MIRAALIVVVASWLVSAVLLHSAAVGLSRVGVL